MNSKTKKPNLFIVGAPKAGTTSLYYYLSQHPEIFMGKIKEPNFFSNIKKLGPTIVIKSKEKYMEIFKEAEEEQYLGEASTTYLYMKGTAERIKAFNPKSKIIITLREPVSRAYSHYLMDKDRFGYESKKTEYALLNENYYSTYGFHGLQVNPYIYPSLYTKHVKYYIDIFGKENVKIVFFEEMIKNQKLIISDIFKWLKIDHNYKVNLEENKNPYKKMRFKKLYSILNSKYFIFLKKNISDKNKEHLKRLIYKKVQKPELENDIKKELYKKFFKDDVEKLSLILSKDLNSLWSIDNDYK